ncbi:putative nucleotidyltransferase [Saccharothrix tamanrassetensis]|uniref:Putative nucleotidyltransferase n=1 Tax=Saccharothrix tamanrassetensis TaxID=1051531 RepID=A0A841CPD5_9PSEU|nr:aminoglycoside adenylyltransferase family protein [Saccharothrix tamanrassetensis]MBB5958224.1 putative nucleotidyltransferase [Saccharothrix tamanrassetensis]
MELAKIVRLVDGTVGAKVLGAYLHGSAVHGGLKPASDVDVLVVTRHSLDDRERRALVDGLLRISGTGTGARPVELSVVVHSEVRPWRYPATADFLYGDWLRDEIEAGALPRPAPMPDLAIMIHSVLAADHVLHGPPAAELLDPVPTADVVRGSLAGIPDLLRDLPGDTRNVVLTLARVWTTLATGEVPSKDAAADWALPRLAPEHRPVLAHAKQLYLTRHYTEETWTDQLKAHVRPHVDAVLAHIEELKAREEPALRALDAEALGLRHDSASAECLGSSGNSRRGLAGGRDTGAEPRLEPEDRPEQDRPGGRQHDGGQCVDRAGPDGAATGGPLRPARGIRLVSPAHHRPVVGMAGRWL